MLANYYGNAVATDSAGDIYTAGAMWGWADFAPRPDQQEWVNTAGDWDGFLAKYDGNDRSLQWVVRLTGVQRQTLSDVAVDAAGSVYVVGKSTGDASFESTDDVNQAIASPRQATVVAKVSPQGVAQWVHALGYGADGSASWGGSIALDGVGHVYVDGGFSGANADFDPGPGVRLPTSTDGGYVLKLHTENGLLEDPSELDPTPGWAAEFAGSSIFLGEPNIVSTNFGLEADATGVYVVGPFPNTVHFEGSALPDLVNQPSSGWDGFLAKVDANGTAVWAKQYTDESPQGVAIDNDSVYTATSFVAKYRKDDGNERWSKPGGAGGETHDLLVQGDKLYVTGSFGGTVDFDLDPVNQFNLTAVGIPVRAPFNMFVWEMNTDGDFIWAGKMGTAHGYGIALDGSGNVVTTGNFTSAADFDPGTGTAALTALGGYEGTGTGWDAFVSRLKPVSPSDPSLMYDQSFPAFQIGSYDRFVDDGDPGYVESGTGWKAGPSGGYNGDSRYHAKGKGANTATWKFNEMAPSGAATYDVFVTFAAKGSNASDAKYNVNGTIVPVNQRVSPSGGWLKLGTFAADAQGKITVVLSDNANGNVIADVVHVVINAPAAASASAAAAAVAQPSNNAALMSATDFWMSDLGNQSTKRKQSSNILDLLSAGIDPLV